MKMIRPVADLQDHLADIAKTVHETGQPVFLPKMGMATRRSMTREMPMYCWDKIQFYKKKKY